MIEPTLSLDLFDQTKNYSFIVDTYLFFKDEEKDEKLLPEIAFTSVNYHF